MSDDPIKLVAELVAMDPIYSDPEDGPVCVFCGVEWAYWPHTPQEHKPDCLWLRAVALQGEKTTT